MVKGNLENKIKKITAILLIALMVFSICACDSEQGSDAGSTTQAPDSQNEGKDKDDAGTVTSAPSDGKDKDETGKKDGASKEDDAKATDGETDKDKETSDGKDNEKEPSFGLELPDGTVTAQTLGFDENGEWEFNVDECFSSSAVSLNIVCPSNAKVYYTLDGTEPCEGDSLYDAPINFAPTDDEVTKIHVLKAAAFFEDGSKSKTATRSFFVSEKIDSRFSMVVLSIIGEPGDLTEKPNGILYGRNYEKRGRAYEKPIYLEMFDENGKQLLSQYCGTRVYGGYSRQYAIKSLKFFSRKSYDENNKNFKLKIFETPRLDGEDKNITKYDKFVMRSHGNDFQFLYLRDELSQALVKQAGFVDYESCVPCAAYLNGEYYGFFWLHENYCDKYFKEKYGKADGEFVVLEGSEKTKKDEDADEATQTLIDEYNTKYAELSELDLTDDANYGKVCDFIDVNNYLDYMAWNIAINNSDWPHNNYKVYKYVPAEGEAAGDGAFDGRWRFLPHDMDYAYGLYDQKETVANYDTLKHVLRTGDQRYAPLLAALMARSDCRTYFKDKMKEFFDGVLSEENLIKTYEELDALRKGEMPYYYEHLQVVKQSDWSVWTGADQYDGFAKSIYDFAKNRKDYALRYLEEQLPDLE